MLSKTSLFLSDQQDVAIGTTLQASSALFEGKGRGTIRLIATAACRITIGKPGKSMSPGAILPAGTREWFTVNSGDIVQVIALTATDAGVLNIAELAE